MEEKPKSPYSSIIGNYIPICKGKIVFNHSGDHSVYYSMIFILAPLIVLVAFNSAELIRDTHWIFYVVLVLFNLGTLYFLCRTWLTEPGIVMKDPTGNQQLIEEPTTIQRRVAGLMVSVKNNRTEYVTKSLGAIPSLINEQNIEGRTLMHIACQFDKIDMVRLLFTYNVDITIRDAYGLLAVHYAVIDNLQPILEEFYKAMGIIDQVEKEAKRQSLRREIDSLIPRYDFNRNIYYIDTDDSHVEHAVISDFFKSEKKPSTEVIENREIHTNEQQPESVQSESTEKPVEAVQDEVTEKSAEAVPENPKRPDMLSYICICNDHFVTVKRCSTCCIYTPPRGYHCRFCDACIRNFDHHCPWVSNCVGIRNHKYFMWFLIISELDCIYGLAFIVAFIGNALFKQLTTEEGFDIVSLLLYSWPSLIYLICCLGFAIPIFNLIVYHMRITGKNMTTHEEISLPPRRIMKSHPETNYYPFNHGWWNNMVDGMCSSNIDSLVNIQTV